MSNIVGIDLGTTFSALAVLNDIGKPEIIPNSEGERVTPSVIYFAEDEPGKTWVGRTALNLQKENAKRCVRWVKREMCNKDYRINIDDKEWSPSELSSLILRKLQQDCSQTSGDIKDVVISVPAHFDEFGRKATMEAGKMAGLNVIGIVNEPTAAAIFYATRHQVSGRVLIYDLGGGTFDVTVADVDGQDVKILCSEGDHKLGGIDFDNKIVEKFETSFQEEHGCNLIGTEEERAEFENQAEDVKKSLSRRPTVKQMLYKRDKNVKFEISRDEFEEAISPILAQTDLLVEMALEGAKTKPSEIDQVILVGGSTRIPAVKSRLEKMFGSPPTIAVNVDESVALGAALHAGLIQLRTKPDSVSTGVAAGLANINLGDCCNHSYGTLALSRDEETGEFSLKNSIIIKKNTPLPCEQFATFYTVSDGQLLVDVDITQGGDDGCEPEWVPNTIKTEPFKLPPNRPAGRPIKATYSYDLAQRMHCTFLDEESGRKLEVDLKFSEDDSSVVDIKQSAIELKDFIVE